MSVDVDEILKDFEPAFRKKIERKVLEATVDGLTSMRPMLIPGLLIVLHLMYIVFYYAIHEGTWLSWLFAVLLPAWLGIAIPVTINACGKNGRRDRLKLAEESGWSIAEFQRMAEQFPDRKKKQFLKDLERNLKEAAAFMA